MKTMYTPTANEIILTRIGNKLMDISATTKMKGLNEEEIARTNRMSSFGDSLTRFGSPYGPKSLDDLLKKTKVSKKEAEEFMAIGYSN